MSEIHIREHANAELVAVGDIIAIYAGNSEPSHVTRVDAVSRLGRRTVVIVTDQGRFDLDREDRVAIVAWRGLTAGHNGRGDRT